MLKQRTVSPQAAAAMCANGECFFSGKYMPMRFFDVSYVLKNMAPALSLHQQISGLRGYNR